MFDVVIIGAGVVGAMIARELSRYDISVCILEGENDVCMGASRANSAIVHAGFDAKPNTLKARLNVRGSEMMEDACKSLGVKYKRNGSLVIAFSEEEEKSLNELLIRGNENGVRDLEIITGEAARKLEPALSKSVSAALHAKTGAIVSPYGLTIAAIKCAMDNGAQLLLNFKVDRIEKTDFGFEIYAGERSVKSRYLINSAGVFSDEISALTGYKAHKVRPRRGEYLLLDKECGSLLSKTVFRTPSKMGKGILVSPTVDGNLLLGPTSVDIDDKTDKSTTKEGFSKIINEARENLPEIDLRKVISSFTGLRAVGDTGDFIIKRIGSAVHLIGIESPGLTAAPAIGEYVLSLLSDTDLLSKKKSRLIEEKSPVYIFQSADRETKNEIIKRDKSYGKIVCRCEGVSEGEILAAIRTNPRPSDLDGIKRRTRAQMGRCQGGFCQPYIMELLARENGIEMESVTKFGGKSNMIMGKTK